jgi:hypothetical protein
MMTIRSASLTDIPAVGGVWEMHNSQGFGRKLLCTIRAITAFGRAEENHENLVTAGVPAANRTGKLPSPSTSLLV